MYPSRSGFQGPGHTDHRAFRERTMATAWTLAKWWFWLTVIGWVGMPLAWRLFRPLPDRGLTLARPLGLLLWGYVLWLGATLGILPNTLGGALAALIAVALLSLWLGRDAWRVTAAGERPLVAWVRRHRTLIFAVEGIFVVAFLLWAYVRAQSPDIATAGGEKFMEITFINGILTSRRFPPHDPWLAGYAISYYYFGYVLVAGLIHLSQVPASVGFNVGFASWFALTVLAAFGVGGNLVCLTRGARLHPATFVRWGGLTAVVLALMGNLEGFLEVLYARRLLPVTFWQWLDIRSINVPYDPSQPASWVPQRFIWWWQASRVLHDRDLVGNTIEVIDEFPAFSFILGDMHPHVLGLPFVLLAVALALSAYRSWRPDDLPSLRWRQWTVPLPFAWGTTGLYALLLGGLAFLNTWDFPIYWALLVGVFLVRTAQARGAWTWDSVRRPLGLGVLLAVLGVLAYVPFYLGFQSQASGLLPNLFNPTRFPQFFVMFGPLLVMLGLLWGTLGRLPSRKAGLRWLVLVWGLPWLFVVFLVAGYLVLPAGREFVERVFSQPVVQQNVAGRSLPQLLAFVALRRAQNPWTFLILGALLAWTLTHLTARSHGVAASSEESTPLRDFVLLLVGLGLLLTYAVEFVYIRDLFGTRMNTVFKFYYQAWVLWSLAGTWALAVWSQSRPRPWRAAGLALAGLFIALGLVYTVLAIPARSQLGQVKPTLDGEAWIAEAYPEDAALIRWVREHTPPDTVILEAAGGSYSFYGRVAAFTGRPTLFGWDFHEWQWRGPALERQAGNRAADIERIYREARGQTLLDLLHRYGVVYLIVGTMERQKYGIDQRREQEFARTLEKVWEEGNTRVYLVP